MNGFAAAFKPAVGQALRKFCEMRTVRAKVRYYFASTPGPYHKDGARETIRATRTRMGCGRPELKLLVQLSRAARSLDVKVNGSKTDEMATPLHRADGGGTVAATYEAMTGGAGMAEVHHAAGAGDSDEPGCTLVLEFRTRDDGYSAMDALRDAGVHVRIVA